MYWLKRFFCVPYYKLHLRIISEADRRRKMPALGVKIDLTVLQTRLAEVGDRLRRARELGENERTQVQ